MTKKKRDDSLSSSFITRLLVYLLIVTTTVTGVSMSRYATSSQGDNTVRVAVFDVVVSHELWSEDAYNDVRLVQEIDGANDYIFGVKNYSDVAVRARLVVVGAARTIKSSTPAGHIGKYIGGAEELVELITEWADISVGETVNFTVKIMGLFHGNEVTAHVEYEQID